jgi:hypothetical protein
MFTTWRRAALRYDPGRNGAGDRGRSDLSRRFDRFDRRDAAT